MPWGQTPNLIELIIALSISTISGAVSISRRILAGQPATILWVISEFLSAILCGYLMYDSYPVLTKYLPEWVTLPVAVAVAAHIGGRTFQELEANIIKQSAGRFWRPPGNPE